MFDRFITTLFAPWFFALGNALYIEYTKSYVYQHRFKHGGPIFAYEAYEKHKDYIDLFWPTIYRNFIKLLFMPWSFKMHEDIKIYLNEKVIKNETL